MQPPARTPRATRFSLPTAATPRGIRSRLCLRHFIRRTFLAALVLISAARTAPADTPTTRHIPADDTSIGYSGYVHMEFVKATELKFESPPETRTHTLARFDRILDIPGKGYRWDNPGTRIRFRTDATHVSALLYFNELHTSASARNSHGIYLIDGATQPAWTFHTQTATPKRAVEYVDVPVSYTHLDVYMRQE